MPAPRVSLKALFQSWNESRGQRVATNDPDFDRHFVVYSNVPDTARGILKRTVIDSILGYRKDLQQAIYFSFVHNTAYVALSHRKSVFEPRIYRNVVNFDSLASIIVIFSWC